MIKTFKSKQLATLWAGKRSRIDVRLHNRILLRLGVLNEAIKVGELNLPGYDFHGLTGHDPQRFTIHVNGPWCITFSFENGNAFKVDFEQYH